MERGNHEAGCQRASQSLSLLAQLESECLKRQGQWESRSLSGNSFHRKVGGVLLTNGAQADEDKKIKKAPQIYLAPRYIPCSWCLWVEDPLQTTIVLQVTRSEMILLRLPLITSRCELLYGHRIRSRSANSSEKLQADWCTSGRRTWWIALFFSRLSPSQWIAHRRYPLHE